MVKYRLIILLTSFPILCFISPAQSAIETGATPPAEDETLIYVMRDWLFTGGGSNWIAVNDQSVDRLSNGRYAVVRAKSGRITLNLAFQGTVVASIVLDDRPGETVYLKWKFGELNFREVSEAEGRKFLQDAKRTKGIKAPLPNNEEIDVLANPSRLGFKLTRPASQKIEPDSEHGVITLFRRDDGRNLELGIWSDQGFVSTLKIKEGVRVRVPAGVHYFLSGNKGTSILKVDVQTGKEYFTWLDYGEGFGGVRLTPVPLNAIQDLKKWLEPVNWVELNSDAITARIRERGDVVNAFIQAEIKNPGSNKSNIQILGHGHAFNSKALKKNGLGELIASNYDQQILRRQRSQSLSSPYSGGIDISGRYESKISGCKSCVPRSHLKAVLTIKQEGNKITGFFGDSGEIEGYVNRGIVTFDWYSSWTNGRGEWEISPDGKELTGTLTSNQAETGKWTLMNLR